MSQTTTLSMSTLVSSGGGRIWLHRYAWALVGLTLVLILAGGNVTSRDAGLAVPDWPLSFGSVNPDGWMTNMGGQSPGVRDEHGHRLIGATVGLMVIGLVIWLRRVEQRGWVRTMGYVALAAVIVQGVMGGLRVTEKSLALAIVHGCFAQAFLCLTIALAVATSPRFPGGVRFGGVDQPRDQALRFWTAGLVGAIYVQLILGALLRHLGGTPAVVVHVLGALVVGGCLVMAALHVFSRPESETSLGGWTIGLFLLYGFQILLGVAAYVLVQSIVGADSLHLARIYVPTIHVTLGAIVLGMSFGIAFRAYALTNPRVAAAGPTEGVTV
ncbi:MAG TPA: COX15/CtaA family protein [Phycisphaerae bacterium]|jgi:cytochrome c oxidase assembly protein subunit 15|nr:cytochrome oxidase assembly protein [Phycisphaerae bacterium]HOB76418.1 COX15/CtaA family protein [Phycisphaerae bacterium]HOJ56455.1 COX15/CtaA family protein [Phycisphaerae bacterium]HOL25715.1 COX15/CtaA family protein [Phycisphaerae bacterium]HPP19592.1 COX15/CtaA family protein [Phycisphaerae bacterium]